MDKQNLIFIPILVKFRNKRFVAQNQLQTATELHTHSMAIMSHKFCHQTKYNWQT